VEGSVFGAISLCFFCLCMKYLGEPLSGFAPNLHGKHVWSLTLSSSKVKDQGHQGQKMAYFVPFGGLRVVCVR